MCKFISIILHKESFYRKIAIIFHYILITNTVNLDSNQININYITIIFVESKLFWIY